VKGSSLQPGGPATAAAAAVDAAAARSGNWLETTTAQPRFLQPSLVAFTKVKLSVGHAVHRPQSHSHKERHAQIHLYGDRRLPVEEVLGESRRRGCGRDNSVVEPAESVVMSDSNAMTLGDLAKAMRSIDFAMLTTRAEDGSKAARPMSNNGEVEFDGDSYYFTWEHSRMVRDIGSDPQVGLTFQGSKGLFGKPPLFVSVEGQAEVIRDKAAFAVHWTSGMDRWFEKGVDTPGVAMIKVHATRIHYWDGEDEGEVSL
jgi:general stress protein 26